MHHMLEAGTMEHVRKYPYLYPSEIIFEKVKEVKKKLLNKLVGRLSL